MSLFSWFRTLRRIVREYDREQQSVARTVATLTKETQSAVKLIRERTEVHADIGFQGSTIIVCGRYKNRDYVNVFSLPEKSFALIVEALKLEARHGRACVIDAPVGLKTVINRELEES